MKNILYTIILSFLFSSVYAGSVDGKGLICKVDKDNPLDGQTMGIWFTDNTAVKHSITGHSISVSEKFIYYEKGTDIIKWQSDIYELNRKNLNLYRRWFGGYKCKLVKDKQDMIDTLYEIISRETKDNQL